MLKTKIAAGKVDQLNIAFMALLVFLFLAYSPALGVGKLSIYLMAAGATAIALIYAGLLDRHRRGDLEAGHPLDAYGWAVGGGLAAFLLLVAKTLVVL